VRFPYREEEMLGNATHLSQSGITVEDEPLANELLKLDQKPTVKIIFTPEIIPVASSESSMVRVDRGYCELARVVNTEDMVVLDVHLHVRKNYTQSHEVKLKLYLEPHTEAIQGFTNPNHSSFYKDILRLLSRDPNILMDILKESYPHLEKAIADIYQLVEDGSGKANTVFFSAVPELYFLGDTLVRGKDLMQTEIRHELTPNFRNAMITTTKIGSTPTVA